MNITFIKKIGCAFFKAFDLINLTFVKKIGYTFFKAFNTKNSIFIKTTQLASATLKAILAKVKKVAVAYFKEVN